MKKIALSTLFLSLLAVGGVALAQGHLMHRMPPPEGGFMPGAGHFAEALGLTQDQKDEAKKIHEAVFEKAKPLMEQLHAQMAEIHALLDAGSASAEEIGTKMIAAHAARKQLGAIHDEAKEQFSALLTDEQRAKFETLMASHGEMHMRHPGF